MLVEKVPVGQVPTRDNNHRSIERAEKGTSLNNAVVLDREKQSRRDQQQQQHEKPPQPTDRPLEIYTSEATPEVMQPDTTVLNIQA